MTMTCDVCGKEVFTYDKDPTSGWVGISVTCSRAPGSPASNADYTQAVVRTLDLCGRCSGTLHFLDFQAALRDGLKARGAAEGIKEMG